jgi:serine phosphatase RsbU (regulator of sigma subunit)
MQTTNSNNTVASELNNTAWNNRYIDREKGLQLALEAKESALKNNQLQDYHFAQLIIAQYLFWKTNEGEHLIIANQSLAYFEKENEVLGTSRANAVCAGMYDQYGEYEKAMRHALNAVKASELIDNDSHKGDCYTLLGQIYSRIHDYASAIQALQKALEIRKKIKEEKAVASSLNLIARNYVLSKQYIEAKKYYEESLLLRETIGDTAGIPWTYLGLASLYSEQKEWKQSLELYTKAEQANQHKEKQFDLLCLLGKGKICLNQASIKKAITYLNEALAIAKSLKISSLESEAHQLLAEAYEGDANLALALSHYKKYNELKQDILSNEKVNMLKNQQIAFSVEHAEKEAEIHRLKHIELKNAFDQIALQHHELEEKSKEIIDSITYAKRIQDAYLPERKLFNTLFENAFLLFKPKDIVSGDFYWYTALDSDTPSRLFAAADCTGHGVPGAIMSVICCNALNEVVTKKNIHQPDLILNEVRNIVTKAFKQQGESTQKDGMDISLVRLIQAGNKTTLQYAGANNPLWIIRKGKLDTVSDNSYTTDTHYLIEIKADKQPIGNYEKMAPFTLHEIDLQEGDALYSFTDGFADQFGGNFGKKLKSKPLKELLLSIQQHSMSEQLILIDKAYKDWKREYEQIDDVCMIGVSI